MNGEFEIVGLYPHNAESYREVRGAFALGERTVGIVQATGTGKSYNALQLAYDNRDKKIVYVVPSVSIIEHIKQIIRENPNLDLERDFPNLKFMTYSSFVNMSDEEISDIPCDLLILDEFHHIGAPIWGSRIQTMVDTHPDMKIFGMTAYTVRDRGTQYERDMANPETDELFSRRIVSRYDLCDAMLEGVLPKPVYRSAHINLEGMLQEIEKKVERLNHSSDKYRKYMELIAAAKKRIHKSPGIADVIKRNIRPTGKYIYFCPPFSQEGVNDLETIMAEAKKWFLEMGIKEEDIVFYSTTSEMGEEGKRNREAFYSDFTLDQRPAGGKLRVMFAINQYNEGVHAPGVDGVIMGRGTTSDIVYFEQLGRALSVRGDTKERFDELSSHSLEELIEFCRNRDIEVPENPTKEWLIERLIAPVIIDLTDNYTFIRELEDNLRNRIKEYQKKGPGLERIIRIRDASFDIDVLGQDLYATLVDLKERLTMSWEKWYELAKKYYEHYGHLRVDWKFRTSDGYSEDANGYKLGLWIYRQKSNPNLTPDQINQLNAIGMIWGEDILDRPHSSLEELHTTGINLVSPDSVEEIAEEHERSDVLKSIINKVLTEKERRVIYLRFGFEDGIPHGLEEIGQIFGVSRERIRQIEAKALRKLRFSLKPSFNTNGIISDICEKEGISYEHNIAIVRNISMIKFATLIAFLKDKGIRLTDTDGTLHKIFSMNDRDLDVELRIKYHTTYEELKKAYRAYFHQMEEEYSEKRRLL